MTLPRISDPAREARARALERDGYVRAEALDVHGDIAAQQWWGRAYVAAEHHPGGRGYPKLTDDFLGHEPGQTTGTRRVRRIQYVGDEVTLRMPSASLIRKFSAANDHGTFDVPVEAKYPGGHIQGWIRVTRTGPAEWQVAGLGVDDRTAAYVTEAANAVLESRNPRLALGRIRDLMYRRRVRAAQIGIPMVRRQSSVIAGVGYNQDAQVLGVRIEDRHYAYRVRPETYAAFLAADSPGAAYNALVKGQRRAAPISSCDACSRFYPVAVGHRCPKGHHAPAGGGEAGNVRAREVARAGS